MEQREKRQDLFALATAYSGQLKLKKPLMIHENEFHLATKRLVRELLRKLNNNFYNYGYICYIFLLQPTKAAPAQAAPAPSPATATSQSDNAPPDRHEGLNGISFRTFKIRLLFSIYKK